MKPNQPKKLKRVVIDMDGTICTEKPTFEKSLAVINKHAREVINKLHDSGVHVIIYTARGWAEYEMTKQWLLTNDIRYEQLICGKPIYDVWIDDRALKFESWDSISKQLCLETE
jgi:uncharacterized HAD superfamily protein